MNETMMSVKTFFEEIEKRLDRYSEEDLRSVLCNLARGVPPHSRRAFLDQLTPGTDSQKAIAERLRQDDLLADIDDLSQEIEDRMSYADDYEDDYDGRWDDEDSVGPYEEFVDAFEDLFDRAAGVFDSGDMVLARKAFESLFNLLGKEDGYGRGVNPEDLGTTSYDDACARYLRSVFETTPLEERPALLFQEMKRTDGSRHQGLSGLIDITGRALPDREPFLDRWIEFLKTKTSPTSDRWLREAVQLAGGIGALEKLAREEGRKRPLAYVDWMAALNRQGRPREVVAAAEEAFSALPEDLPARAAVADELCIAADELQDREMLYEAQWQGFVAKPELRHLVIVAKRTPCLAERQQTMKAAARHMEQHTRKEARRSVSFLEDSHTDPREHRAWVPKSAVAHAWLLAGAWQKALALVKSEKELGWSSSQSAQGLVLAAILAALSEGRCAMPANIRMMWLSALDNSIDFTAKVEISQMEALYADVFASARFGESEVKKLLDWCVHVAKERVSAIVENKRRKSYHKAATLAVAVAEALRFRRRPAEADGLLGDLKKRYPLHRAFQDELSRAVSRA